ncbi:MAG: NAD-dependent dihydropyrimidine dehydrogenase subunit PreA [Candidatus Aureabacteria bacterium]|nr:NAD-dependent dihydropyrimidine dehydrogenase subunit PreA [Candidatus Auribacterota bacterium]
MATTTVSELLSVDFCGLQFKNPFILASAPPTTTGEMIMRAFDAGWAGAVIKTVVPEGEPVINVAPRLASLTYEKKRMAVLQNIELTTDRGLKVWLKEMGQIKRRYPSHIVIGSIMAAGSVKKDWHELTRRVQDAGADMIECNLGCPHGMPERGMGSVCSQDPEITKHITQWVKDVARIPVMIKLTPNITDIKVTAKAAQAGGADAISAINTVAGLLGVDLDKIEPFPSVNGFSTYGGCSGPGMKPIALRAVCEIFKATHCPVSGIGGVSTWRDAAEFILLGATTVQVCTAAMHWGYRIIEDLCEGLANYMEDHRFSSIAEMVGLAAQKMTTHESLSRSYRLVSSIDKDLCIGCGLCHISCRDAAYQAVKWDAKKREPTVDEELCVGCGLCSHVCPIDGCVVLKESKVPLKKQL